MRRLQPYLIASLFLFLGCEDKNVEQPLLPGLPLSVRNIVLQKDVWTNSETIIANGVNAMHFKIGFLNADGIALKVDTHPLEIWINGSVKLPPPYRFSTEQEGLYKFSVRTKNGEIYLDDAAIVRALKPPMPDPHSLRVIFHYFQMPTSQLSPQQRKETALAYIDSLAKVNDAFANKRGSKDPNAVDANIKFYLATTDRAGNPLPYTGVEFIDTPSLTTDWSSIEEHISTHNWSPSAYLNVWVADLEEYAGVAYTPEPNATDIDNPSGYYGVVMDRRYVTTRTLAHEFGHMLNLWHVFGTTDCYDIDGCDDTRPYNRGSDVFKTLHKLRTGCNGEKFIATNYMDYHYSENNTFTRDQVVRMHHILHKTPFLPGRKNVSSGRTETKQFNLRGSFRPDNSRIVLD